MFDILTRLLGLGRIFDELFRLIKIRFICSYVTIVDTIRSLFVASIAVIICLLLLFTGFILLHVALFLMLPWSISERALLFALLGSVYIFVPAVIVIFINRRLQWFKHFGVKELIDRLSSK
jgi:inner membrane protein involved in colicin E2 resistance